MLKSLVTLTAVCTLATAAPLALADPDPDPAVQPVAADSPTPAPPGEDGPPPDNGIVASEEPGIVKTPDGWTLSVAAKDETQLPIPPLTTALSSREFLAGGTFTGTVSGAGSTSLSGGTLEAGYQIGCGISLAWVKLDFGASVTPAFSATGVTVGAQVVGGVEVHPQPGEVINVSVDKKKYKGKEARVTLKDIHIKIDGCVGQSFLRSYAVLTSSSKDNDDIVAYYGVTKTV